MMDLLVSAAYTISQGDDLESLVPLTPEKGKRRVFGDITNALNISPDNLENSTLKALFTEPTKYVPESKSFTPKNKAQKAKSESPLTPTTNLKLLTRIASMEESLPNKKLFVPDENTPPISSFNKNIKRSVSEQIPIIASNGRGRSLKRYQTFCQEQIIAEAAAVPEYSRKDKSLGTLSMRFFEHFHIEVTPLETPRRLVIDEVAALLGTERRRVYDIMNVLESINMACRVQKNMYQWMGNQHLVDTLKQLKGLALQLDLPSDFTDSTSTQFKLQTRIRALSPGEDAKGDTRKDKSLGILCQKFVMLFLISKPPHIISLDHAIKLFISDDGHDLDRLRTRGRRLYDIANVLMAVKLIKKAPTPKSFQYIGPQVEPAPANQWLMPISGIAPRHSLLNCHAPLTKRATKLSTFREVEVTPSDNHTAPAEAVQKRGRPRILHQDFKDMPVDKKPKMVRTQSLGYHRHPSLEDICQVAEIEHNRLLKEDVNPQNKEENYIDTSLGATPLYSVMSSASFRRKKLGNPKIALKFPTVAQPGSSDPPQLTSSFKPLILNNLVKEPVPTKPQQTVSSQFARHYQNVENNPTTRFVRTNSFSYNKPSMITLHRPTAFVKSQSDVNKPTENIIRLVMGSGEGKVNKSENEAPNNKLHTSWVMPQAANVPSSQFVKLQPTLNPRQFVTSNQQSQNAVKLVSNISTNMKPQRSRNLEVNISPNVPQYRQNESTFVILNQQLGNQSVQNKKIGGISFRPLPKTEFRKVVSKETGLSRSSSTESTDPEIESILGDSLKFSRPFDLIKKENINTMR